MVKEHDDLIGARTAPEVALSVYTELITERRHHDLPVLGPVLDARTPVITEAVDPVCGMTVAIGESALSIQDGGATRYFCGPGCLHAFADDPQRYRDRDGCTTVVYSQPGTPSCTRVASGQVLIVG